MSEQEGVIWEPMPGNIVVEVIGDTERVGSLGIIFAPANREVPRTTGKVIAIYEPFLNDDNTESAPYVAVGDIVIFGRFTGTEISYDRKKVVVLKEADILTKVKAPVATVERMEAER